MIYWLFAIFMGMIVWLDPPPQVPPVSLEDQTLSQQARNTVQYLNAINDWRYSHPEQKEGTLPESAVASFSGLHHVLQANRVYLYQSNQPGLMAALLHQTRQSALIGLVKNHRMYDSAGNDMQVNVPATIPDGCLVYLN
ncbi:TPA: type IV pilus biogenesis protein PilM [Serratia marcescens]